MSAQIIALPRYGASPEEWDHFTLLLGLTADLLPVVSNPKAEISPDSKMKQLGKTPSRYNQSRKVAGIASWTSHIATNADIARWSREPDYGICIQTRHVRALDVDIEDNELQAEVHVAIDTLLGLELPTRRRLGSAKFLLAFRMPGEFTKRILRTAKGNVEFLANGQQFIACGTHPAGERYQWVGGLPDELPVLSSIEFEALWLRLEERFAIEPTITRNTSSKSTKLSEAAANDETAKQLHARNLVLGVERDGRLHIECPFKDSHTTESSISATSYFPANTGGYAQGHFKCLHAHCEKRSDDEFRSALGLDSVASEFDVVVGGISGAAAPSEQCARFAAVQAAAFASRSPLAWLVKGVIPAGALCVVYGESGAGKSFLALDLSAAVARGIEWRSKRVKQGRVVYVVAEGAAGFQNRLKAYAQAHGIELESLDVFVVGDAPNLMQAPDVKLLLAQIHAIGPVAMVVIDTLARTMVGGDENSAQDMGRAVAHCAAIQKHTHAAVVLIHHAGKDATKGARGSSALRAASDAEIEVVRVENARAAIVGKMKDGEDGEEFNFKLAPITVGMDDDGEDVTSCVVEHVASSAGMVRRREPKGTNEKAVMRAVRDCISLAGEAPFANDVIEAAIGMLQPPEEGKRDKRREHVVRALDGLVADGALTKGEGGTVGLAA